MYCICLCHLWHETCKLIGASCLKPYDMSDVWKAGIRTSRDNNGLKKKRILCVLFIAYSNGCIIRLYRLRGFTSRLWPRRWKRSAGQRRYWGCRATPFNPGFPNNNTTPLNDTSDDMCIIELFGCVPEMARLSGKWCLCIDPDMIYYAIACVFKPIDQNYYRLGTDFCIKMWCASGLLMNCSLLSASALPNGVLLLQNDFLWGCHRTIHTSCSLPALWTAHEPVDTIQLRLDTKWD